MVNATLAELAGVLDKVRVDGEKADSLIPEYSDSSDSGYLTSAEIARDSGISLDSPRYSGNHHHCQYSRTC